MLITDERIEYESMFRRSNKFNVLRIQKGRVVGGSVEDDIGEISGQLKTHISRLTSLKQKPISSPVDFNILIKENIANRVSIDEFLKARVYSPDCLSKIIDRSKANVIIK